MSKLKNALKKVGKAAAIGAGAMALSKMGKKPTGMDAFTKKGMSLATGDASAAEAIAAADRARKKAMILDTGDGRAMEAVYGKFSKGSKTTVMAKGCKLGRKRRTIIT
jgi:hypothetical protein